MNSEETIQRAEIILNSMKGLRLDDVVEILSIGIYIVVTAPDQPQGILDKTCFGFNPNPNLQRKRPGCVSAIDKDQEVKIFIQGIDGYLTVEAMHDELVKQFGKERSPSKSSIGRYLKKIAGANAPTAAAEKP